MKFRKVKKEKVVENGGKMLLDIGKITFTAFVIGGILKGSINTLLFIFGTIISAILIGLGLFFTSLED